MAENLNDQAALDAVQAQLAAAAQLAKTARLNRTTDRRKGEERSKGRVKRAMLRPDDASRDFIFSVRTNREKVEALKALADELSQPRAKVSVASLFEEAVDLLIAHYNRGANGGENP